MNERTLTTQAAGALANAVALWADARTDPASARRLDLLRDKQRAVGGFFQWVGKPPDQVSPLDVKSWQAELEARGLAHSTTYCMVSRVSSFYRWAMSDPDLAERIKRKPVDLARPKAPRAYQSESCKSLDDDEAQALLGVVRGKAQFDVVGKRDYALLLLYLGVGLRRCEVLQLRWGDVRLNGTLTLTTRVKGGERLTLEVNDQAVRDALVDYLKASGRWGDLGPDDPLWTSHDRANARPGAPLTGHALARNLKRYAAKVGLEDFHLHQLRHTFARLVGDASGSLGDVQEALGHKNRSTTRVQAVGVRKDKFSSAVLGRLGV